MSLKDPRADSLPLIRDFIVTINQGVVKRLSDFSLIKPSWSRTRCYHYWSAMRDLGLAKLEKAKIVLLPLGMRLVKVAQFARFQPSGMLNDAEMEIFREGFLKHEPVREFLSLFISTGEYFSEYDQLKKNGGIVTMKILRGALDKKKMEVLITTAFGKSKILRPTEARAMIWSLKLWCKQTNIIDEIYLEKNSLYMKYFNLPQRVLFPVKSQHISPQRFKQMLNSLIEKDIKEHYLPIPVITYYFCTKFFISLKDFHEKLKDLYRKDPYHYYLETSSVVDFDKSPRRIHNYNNYIILDGYWRNALIVRKKEVTRARRT